VTTYAGPAAVLVGPPGADVVVVAVELGRLLGLPVLDTDAAVERAAGASVAELFVERGEDAFRELERAAVVQALAGHDGVLALGGGAVADPRTQDELAGYGQAGGTVVFLDVGVADAARRLGFNVERPPGLGNPRQQWQRLMEQRRPLYERVATVTETTDGRTAEQVAEQVAEALAAALRRPTAP
jgi:shikimate kinase